MALTKKELSALAEQAREEFVEVEHQAAEQEIAYKRAQKVRSDSIIPVRLDPELYAAVQAAALTRHLAPSTLIRQWVAHSVASDAHGINLADELERLAALARAQQHS